MLEKGCEEIGSALESRPEVARPPKVTLLRPEDPAVPQCARSRGGPPPPPQTDGLPPSRSADFAPRTHRRPTPAVGRRIGCIVPIGEVVAGQVFKGRRTSLRAGSALQVFARSGTASEDKDAGHRPGGSGSVGHAFKTGVGARAPRRVRFPSASAWRERGDVRESVDSLFSPLTAYGSYRNRADPLDAIEVLVMGKRAGRPTEYNTSQQPEIDVAVCAHRESPTMTRFRLSSRLAIRSNQSRSPPRLSFSRSRREPR